MRRHLALSIAVAASLAPSIARAAEADDLPAGNDPPRLVPIAVIDTYYAYHDTPPPNREATFMTTAVRHDEFQVNLAALGVRLEHAKLLGTLVLQAGTSVDALYPPRSAAPQLSNPQVWKHIQLASIGYRLGSDVTVEAGVMPSHIGNEGFVSTKNWNYTRALISDATPYFVAGAKLTWRAAPTWTIAGLVYNGWNTYDDVNRSKSGGLYVSWAPSETFSITDSAHVGPGAFGTHALRVYDDLVLKAQLHARIAIALEGGYGFDKVAGVASKNVIATAAWVRWLFTDTTYFSVRGELLYDDHGIFTGSGQRTLPSDVEGQRLYEGTFTLGWIPHPNFIARVEAMHRLSNNPYFAAGSVGDSSGASVTNAQTKSTTFVASLAFSY